MISTRTRRRLLVCLAALTLAQLVGAGCGPTVMDYDSAIPDDVDLGLDADPDAPPEELSEAASCRVSGLWCSSHSQCCFRFCDYNTHSCR